MTILKNIAISGKYQKPIVTDVFFEDNKHPKRIIIFCHGYKGFKDWGAWHLMAETLAKENYIVITFNFSYNGCTLQHPEDFKDLEAFGNNNYIKELDDLDCVINWAYKNTVFNTFEKVPHITVIGHSRGGGIATIKAAEDARVNAVISLAAVSNFANRSLITSNLEAWKKEGVKYVINGRTKQKMPHYYQLYTNFMANKKRLDIKASAEKINKPHLIIHGNKDSSVSVNEAENLQKWSANSILEIIDNADHVFNTKHPWQKPVLSKELQNVVDLCIKFIATT